MAHLNPDDPMFTWRRLREEDFPLLRRWLAEPHVARWWNHETSEQAVLRDFGPAARGEEPCEDLLVSLAGRPFGLVQRYRLADYPEDVAEFAPIIEVPERAMGLDYLIGEPQHIGRGLGPEMIRSVVRATWTEHPTAACVIVPVSKANRPSWRALEKAGLHRIAAGDMIPDNPIDDPAHYIYRVDRPTPEG